MRQSVANPCYLCFCTLSAISFESLIAIWADADDICKSFVVTENSKIHEHLLKALLQGKHERLNLNTRKEKYFNDGKSKFQTCH